ncbi:MAG TPA: hypothetical protein VFS92_05225, partial [Planctomycetota bacterium]|nr:hypothetical protein [Planctomycetota bacterium]
MRLDVSLQQRQQLQLKLAPQMIQAIEILQLPNIDLLDRIELELAENEVLAVDDESGGAPEAPAAAAPAEPGTAEASAEGESADGEPTSVGDAEFTETLERLTSMAEEDREIGLHRSRAEGQEASDRKLEALQATAAPPPTLQDTLAAQLSLLEAPGRVLLVARAIVYSLDEDGLLPVHPLARPILGAMDADGNLVRPIEEILEPRPGAAAGDAPVDAAAGEEARAPEGPARVPYGSYGTY